MKGASGMHFEVHVRGGDGCCDSFVARGDTLEQAVEYAREWIKLKSKTKGEEIADWWDRGVPNGELSKAIDKAIAEEREACAMLADECCCPENIARYIRDRKP
jgi:hypothetical protein